MKKPKFGIGIPTGTEGLMYPIPFAKVRDNIRMAKAAEKLGFDSVWGNDHVATQHYVREEFGSSPNYYAPLLVLTAIAENTTNLKLATALLVVPFRHPVNIAKELATLDHISNGRLMVGVGIGAYREEFECMMGEKARSIKRGELLDESLTIVKKIFEEDKVTYKGNYFDVKSLESYPKPLQKPFPFYIGGNSPKGHKRVAKFGTGWLPAVLTPDEVKTGVSNIQKYCEEIGRNVADIDIAPQLSISIGKTHEEAEAKFKVSQVYKHLESLKQSTLKDQDTGEYGERNLIGTPDEIGERIKEYAEAGVTTFSALLFATNTVDEMIESMQFFSEEVISKL
ncbi:MAG: LLM class flavin-dependent oxidoreductase [Tepidanaerobacteraceae bacterium]|nr:LLM class flavin-dependent oxidoreductase [Tepidanaerobacteraceae bacterium]